MDWKQIVGTIAPILGTSLGGPLAGAAIKTLSQSLLGVDNGTEAQIAEAVKTASPEQLAELKRVDNEFAEKMAELGFKETELAYQDKINARSLFAINIWPQITLSAVFVTGYFIVMGLLIAGTITIEKDVMVLVTAVTGVLTAGVTGILQFWFGSSLGSKEKTQVLGK